MIGKRFGQWTLEAEVGRGAMGSVYRATGGDGRIAAVKILAREYVKDDMIRGRFQREVEALGQLDHPHIVPLYDFGAVDGLPYFAMKYINGLDYERRLHERGRLPWSEALAVGQQIADALKHAHDRGVIHRDLKPANILIEGNADGADGPFVMLTDFGVAKLFATSPLTAAGSFVGTAAYLAPEQASGKPPTKRGDFYSLGCVLYALVVGRPPFPGDNVGELLHQHRFAQPEQPLRLVPDLPHEINALIMQLLDKDPSKRPADGGLLAKQLERMIGKLERQGRSPGDTRAGFDTNSAQMRPTELAGQLDELSKQGPGPATFAAEFVRDELARQQRTSPLGRLFNHPAVLVPLFLLCVAGIVYGLWRPQPTPEAIVAEARPLMESDRPEDWDKAYHRYLRPLAERLPQSEHVQTAQALKQRIDDHADRQRAFAKSGFEPTASEAAFFYRLGLQRLQAGDTPGARRMWWAVVKSFSAIESEERWVKMANDGLKELNERVKSDHKAALAALEKARQLRDAGNRTEASDIWDGLESLYRDDPDGAAVMEAIRKDRAK